MAFQEVGNLNCFVYSQQLLQDKTESSRGEKQHDMFAKRFDIYIYFATTLYMRCWLKLAFFVLFLHLCIFCCTASRLVCPITSCLPFYLFPVLAFASSTTFHSALPRLSEADLGLLQHPRWSALCLDVAAALDPPLIYCLIFF